MIQRFAALAGILLACPAAAQFGDSEVAGSLTGQMRQLRERSQRPAAAPAGTPAVREVPVEHNSMLVELLTPLSQRYGISLHDSQRLVEHQMKAALDEGRDSSPNTVLQSLMRADRDVVLQAFRDDTGLGYAAHEEVEDLNPQELQGVLGSVHDKAVSVWPEGAERERRPDGTEVRIYRKPDGSRKEYHIRSDGTVSAYAFRRMPDGSEMASAEPMAAPSVGASGVVKFADQLPESYSEGWHWPLNRGRYTSRYGLRLVRRTNPRTGEVAPVWQLHEGIDMAFQEREPIHAAADGVVAFAKDAGNYGKLTIILHDRQGTVSIYAHQAAINGLREGQRVEQGQEIGYVGRTGSPGLPPHLHFEIRNGKNQASDPTEYVTPPRGIIVTAKTHQVPPAVTAAAAQDPLRAAVQGIPAVEAP